MFENLNSSDQQSFIYSSLLLVFLVSSLIFRREIALSKALKYLAIWALLAFVGVGLYAYRYQFSDFKERILEAINPTAARMSDRGELIINLSSDGHFYIDIKINNMPMRFMIDTGASDIVIDKMQAQKIGINMQSLVFDKRYETANGASYGASVVFGEVQVGEVTFTNIRASVNSAELGVPLLGMSFLRQFKKYEFYQDRLVLTL